MGIKNPKILFVLLPIWVFGAFTALKMEVVSLKAASGLLSLSAEDRAAAAGGPLYELSKRASSIIPKGSAVYFFPEGPDPIHYSGRLNYFLYPLKATAVNPGQDVPAEDIRRGGYLLFFSPEGLSAVESGLTSVVPSEKLYERMDERGRQAIYRVKGERG